MFGGFIFINKIDAKEPPMRNIDIIDSLLYNYTTQLAQFLADNNIKSIDINLNSHPAENFLKRNIVQAFAEKGIEVYQFNNDNKDRESLTLTVKEVTVKYQNNSRNDQVNRIFYISISGFIRDKDQKLLSIPKSSIIHQDSIDWKDLDEVENSPFDFAKSPRPERKESFFKKIAEPVIIIGSALITLILLFTIRSN